MARERLTNSQRLTLKYIEQIGHTSGESDRGHVIVAAAQTEDALEQILRAFLIKDKAVDDLFDNAFAPLANFSGKARMAFVLGLISREELDEVDALRRVRNVFAHEVDATFEHAEVKKAASRVPVFSDRLCSRDAILHLAINLVPHLLYRSLEVRRRSKRASPNSTLRRGNAKKSSP